MTYSRQIALVVIGAIIALAGVVMYFAQYTFGAPAIRDENNIPAVFGSSCEAWSASQVTVGNQAATEIQASSTRRALLRIEQPLNATNTLGIALNGSTATANRGIVISSATSTSLLPYFEAGLTTDFPYTGPVSLITSSGSTTVTVTSCTY